MRSALAVCLLLPGALVAQSDRTLFITVPVTLDPAAPASFACRTTQSAVLHLDIVDERRAVVFKSQDWGAEPNVPVTKRLALGDAPRLRRDFIAQLSVKYRDTAPGVAFAMGQGIAPEALGPSVAKTGFVPDPVRPPGGRFDLFLPAPATVSARVWAGQQQAGPPVFSNRYPDLPEGPNPLTWDLRNAAGRLVPGGRYLGRLDCSPVKKGLRPVFFIVSFTVETR